MDYNSAVFGMFGGRENYEKGIERLVKFAQFLPTERVLEVCCGTGVSTRFVFDHILTELTAVELNQERMAMARWSLPNTVRLLTTDALKLDPKKDGKYDLILCINGFYYFDNPQDRQRFYDMADRMLRPGGSLVFNVKLRDYNGVRPIHNALGAAARRIAKEMKCIPGYIGYGRDRGFIETDYTPENFDVGQPFRITRQEVFPLFLQNRYGIVEYWADYFCELTNTRKTCMYENNEREEPIYTDFKDRFYHHVYSIPLEQCLLKAELFVDAQRKPREERSV